MEGNALETPETSSLPRQVVSQINMRPCLCYPVVIEAILYHCLLWILPAVTGEAQSK